MTRVEREANLVRLCRELQEYSLTQAPPPAVQVLGQAERLSASLFLANSSSRRNFARICDTGFIACQDVLAAMGAVSLDPLGCETVLGTTGDVFFYLAPFRFPSTACGFLFAGTLENEHADDGVGTPFDSGGLHQHFERADPVEPARAFLGRHELPVPQHRQYLERSMRFLFHTPEDYVEEVQPFNPGPLGISCGDSRRWTHEVRIPGRVFVRTGHLQAVFASRSLVATSRPVENLFKWCSTEGVDNIAFDHPSGDDFEELRRQSLEYVRSRLY
jgi:hypothetical protein